MSDLTDALRKIERLLRVAPEHRHRMKRWEAEGYNDTDNTAALAGSDRTILIMQMDAAATAIEEVRHSPHLWSRDSEVREAARLFVQVDDLMDQTDREAMSAWSWEHRVSVHKQRKEALRAALSGNEPFGPHDTPEHPALGIVSEARDTNAVETWAGGAAASRCPTCGWGVFSHQCPTERSTR